MNRIQKTISVTEALNERINIIEEEIELYKNERLKLVSSKIAKRIKKTFLIFAIIGLFIFALFLMLFAFMAEDGLGAIVLILLVNIVLLGVSLSAFKGINLEENRIRELEEIIARLTMEVNKKKEERTETILGYERQIKQEEFLDENNLSMLEKECPMCAESVKIRAKKCRFCGYDFMIDN